jgi:hypothetical protein
VGKSDDIGMLRASVSAAGVIEGTSEVRRERLKAPSRGGKVQSLQWCKAGVIDKIPRLHDNKTSGAWSNFMELACECRFLCKLIMCVVLG